MSQEMQMENHVMISYHWDSKEEIIKLEAELKNRGLKVWRDDACLISNGQPLTEQLGKGFIQINIQLGSDK